MDSNKIVFADSIRTKPGKKFVKGFTPEWLEL